MYIFIMYLLFKSLKHCYLYLLYIYLLLYVFDVNPKGLIRRFRISEITAKNCLLASSQTKDK